MEFLSLHFSLSTADGNGSNSDQDAGRGLRIRVRGLVQGVGFRPTVWRLARNEGLCGEVWNDAEGVLIRAWGDAGALQRFAERLRREAPPLARVEAIECSPLFGAPIGNDFRIAASHGGEVHTGIVPDTATCSPCRAEIFDPENRRYRYPFTNCTHCGPRLSIVRSLPYDRGNTSMAVFPLCLDCQAEYEDPADRRFHAQPNACPNCGPRVWLEGGDGRPLETGDAITIASRLLEQGHILAVKGLGGFHLACDAACEAAVMRLRRRKRRYAKPFALMARDPAVIQSYCRVSADEKTLLESPAAPIVILEADGPRRVAEAVAPGQRSLGFMLPYTPLHHLLLQNWARPLVLTSGNRSEEPPCIDNAEARERLGDITDDFLLHDREIVNRVDDSVVRVMDGAPRLLRRARGYAPAPIILPPGFEAAPELLALGGELKNTFCLLKDGRAVVSPHQGDLEDAVTYRDYRRHLDLYRHLFQHRPRLLAVDRHPEYLSTKLGRAWAEREGLELCEVQHHHAHIASCLAEHGVPLDSEPVLGVALDGLGYGDDGTLWGGEFLLADYRGFRRLAAFKPVALPGGAQAMREPWRNTYAHLADDWAYWRREFAELPLIRFLEAQPLATLEAMRRRSINCPAASSCGRLFDAVAAAIGICRERVSYEGQAAVELEAALDHALLNDEDDSRVYRFELARHADLLVVEPLPLWRALLQDLAGGAPVPVMAARFHRGLALAVLQTVQALSQSGAEGVKNVVLCGGVFQNKTLLEGVGRRLRDAGFGVLVAERLPVNDGGLSLGQAVAAAARFLHRG